MALTGGGGSGGSGGGAAGTAKWERPASGQALVVANGSSNGSTFYTVPAGYYFKGYFIHSNMQYSPQINNQNTPKCFMAMSRDHGENNARGNSQSNDIVLPPGSAVECGYSMEVNLIGNLYTA